MNQMNRTWIEAEATAAAGALTSAGFEVGAAPLRLMERDDRFAAILPDARMAWFPLNKAGAARLAREGRVLRLLARHCDFRVPLIDHEAPDGWQLRQPVPGDSDPWATYERVKHDRGFADAVGASMGVVLASQHTKVPTDELGGWLPAAPSWPPARASIAADLVQVTDDRALLDRALQVVARYEEEERRVFDRVLTHSDFGFHNTVIDADTGRLAGVFDYDDAAFADRHHDFKYLLLDIADEVLFHSAVAAYRAAGGASIDEHRVRLLNAASAVGFLAFRAGHSPNDKPAGRTLAEDLTWTQLALARAEA